MLRQSFAKHLIDHGTDLRLIQTMLGHESIETIPLYIHICIQALRKIINIPDRI